MTDKTNTESKLLSKSQIVWLIVASIIVLLIPIVIIQKSFWFSLDNQDAAYIGDALGGITAPFIGVLSCILVYIAFRSQYLANKEIQNQFKKQNDDALFFRLIDTAAQKINNSNIELDKKLYTGNNIMPALCNQFKQSSHYHIDDFGRKVATQYPEIIATEYFEKLYGSIEYSSEYDKNNITDGESLKNYIISKDKQYKENYFKYSDSSILRKIGLKYLYSAPFELKKEFNSNVAKEVILGYNGFFEGYFRNLKYLINFISNHPNNKFYLEYYVNTLTSFEKIFIYYYCFSSFADKEFKKDVIKLNILEELYEHKELFYSCTDESLEKDLANLI